MAGKEQGLKGPDQSGQNTRSVGNTEGAAWQPPFETAFPTFYGTTITRGFRPALERAILEGQTKR